MRDQLKRYLICLTTLIMLASTVFAEEVQTFVPSDSVPTVDILVSEDSQEPITPTISEPDADEDEVLEDIPAPEEPAISLISAETPSVLSDDSALSEDGSEVVDDLEVAAQADCETMSPVELESSDLISTEEAMDIPQAPQPSEAFICSEPISVESTTEAITSEPEVVMVKESSLTEGIDFTPEEDVAIPASEEYANSVDSSEELSEAEDSLVTSETTDSDAGDVNGMEACVTLLSEDDSASSPAPQDVIAAASGEVVLPESFSPQDLPEDVLPATQIPTSGTEGFVYRLYQVVHHREPDADGFSYWVNALNSGRCTAADLVVHFFESPEYENSGRTNAQIVTDCYNTMLDRAPEAEGFQYWKNRLDVGMTAETLLAGFVRSQEFNGIARQYGITPGSITVTNPLDLNYERTYFVYRLYRNCLGRLPEKAGQTYWCKLLNENLSGAQIAQSFIFGPECDGFRYGNAEFVEMLYKTMMGRASELEGFQYWTNRLNYTDTRERVVNKFLAGPEFKGQCEKAQIVVGSSIPEPDNTNEWKYNIEVLRLCNLYRKASGLPDLYTREDLLWDLSMIRAEEIASQFSHTRPDGSRCFSLFTQQGFYGYLGENVAGGQVSPTEVVTAWMNSPGHQANILNKNYTYMATGYRYDPGALTHCLEGTYAGRYVQFMHYWAQCFCNYGISVN